MANLPDRPKQSSVKPARAEKIRRYLHKGYTPQEAAKKTVPKPGRKQRLALRQAYRILATDQTLQQAIAEEAKGILVRGVPVASTAVTKRASRGRVDAAKLVFEASGFYNPRIQHEHSGDIKVTIDIPRPERVDERPGNSSAAGPGPEVVDADVVED